MTADPITVALVTSGAVTFAALVYIFWKIERINANRSTCRCCGCPIKNGGYPCAGLGLGFCAKCAATIMRKVREGRA